MQQEDGTARVSTNAFGTAYVYLVQIWMCCLMQLSRRQAWTYLPCRLLCRHTCY